MLLLDGLYLDSASLHEFFSFYRHSTVVALQKVEFVKELPLHDVHAVVTIHKLHDRAVIVSYCHIVAHHQRFKLLNQAAL